MIKTKMDCVAPLVIYSNAFSLMILKSGVVIWSVLARKVDPGVLEGGRESRPARCLSLTMLGSWRLWHLLNNKRQF